MNDLAFVAQTELGEDQKASYAQENNMNNLLIKECGWLFDSCL